MKTRPLFYFHKLGAWRPEDIETVITEPGTTLLRCHESEAAIEAVWQKLLAAGFRPWPNDLKPTSYRFAGVEQEEDGGVVVTLDPCLSYRDRIGSRTDEFGKQFDSRFYPMPLAVTTVLTALDSSGEEKMMVTMRDATQDVKPGGFHVSTAGVVNIQKDKTPTEAVYREALEECGATKDEITDLSLRAFVYGPWTLHMEMIYFAKLSISCEEVMSRKHGKEDIVLFIPKTIGMITWLLLIGLHAAVPVGAAALVLLGEEVLGGKAGKDWKARMSGFVRGAGISYSALSEDERKALDEQAVKNLGGFF